MRNPTISAQARFTRTLLVALAFCALAALALTTNATAAHALFTSDVDVQTSHTVKAFPTGITGSVSNTYKVRSKTIDRNQLTVTVTMSDGTKRVLGTNEYSLSTGTISAGFKGNLGLQVGYTEAGHKVSGSFNLSVNEAYGATYGNTLVFGRGIPADTYGGKALTRTTWGIEDGNLVNKWDATTLVSVVDIDTVAPRNMASWFGFSETLKTVALEQMDTSKVTSLASLFEKDYALTSVTGLENWNTSSVTNMCHTFNYCYVLASPNISGWNTANVTNMRGMFDNCGNITTLDLSRWNVSKVTDMAFMFSMEYVTSKLTSLGSLTNWNTANVTEMSYMFRGCEVLSNIGNVNGWNTGKVTGMIAMFEYCRALSGVNCRGWNVANVVDKWDFNLGASGVTAPNWS